MPTGMVLPSASFTSGESRMASPGKAASTSSGVIPNRAARQPARRTGIGGEGRGGDEEGEDEEQAHAVHSNPGGPVFAAIGTSDIIHR